MKHIAHVLASFVPAPIAVALTLGSLAFATPARAAGVSTGIQATDVAPLVRGVFAQSVQVFVYAGCFLALDDDQTCIEIAGKARDGVVDP